MEEQPCGACLSCNVANRIRFHTDCCQLGRRLGHTLRGYLCGYAANVPRSRSLPAERPNR